MAVRVGVTSGMRAVTDTSRVDPPLRPIPSQPLMTSAVSNKMGRKSFFMDYSKINCYLEAIHLSIASSSDVSVRSVITRPEPG